MGPVWDPSKAHPDGRGSGAQRRYVRAASPRGDGLRWFGDYMQTQCRHYALDGHMLWDPFGTPASFCLTSSKSQHGSLWDCSGTSM